MPGDTRIQKSVNRARPTIFLKLILYLLACALVVSRPASADDQSRAAQQFINDGINHILSILKDQGSSQQSKLNQLRSAFRSYFDHVFIGPYAAGNHFRAASPAEQKAYLQAVEEYVVTTYGGRLLSYSSQIELQLKASDIFAITGATRFGADYMVVHSHIKRTVARAITIDWHIRSAKGKFKVIDVTLNGISPIQVYRSEFASVIRRRNLGLAGLTAEIQAKNAANRDGASIGRQ